jgi:hypothetical protein
MTTNRYKGNMQSNTVTHARDPRRDGRAWLSLALLLCLTALAGCQADDSEKHIGRQLTKLHEQMNGEETNAIWNAADDGFRNGVSKADFTRMFITNHRKLGDAGSGLIRDTEIYNTFQGTYITQWLTSDFANDPDVHEHVVWFGKNGVYKLYRYDVSSKLLK